jgi:hypothetical protein
MALGWPLMPPAAVRRFGLTDLARLPATRDPTLDLAGVPRLGTMYVVPTGVRTHQSLPTESLIIITISEMARITYVPPGIID